MKKITTVFFCLALIPLFGMSQIVQPRNNSFKELEFFVNTDSNNPKYSEAEGTRFLNEEFIQAKINDIKETQFVRFNAVDHSIEAQKGNGEIMTLSKSYAYRIALLDGSDRIFQTGTHINEDGNSEWSFFEIMHQSEKFTLFLKETIKFIPGKPEKSSYEKAVPPKFVKGKDRYYILGLQSQHQNLLFLPKKKKDFLQLFGSSAKEIDKMMKKDKLKTDRKEDLVKVLEFYFSTK